MRVPTGTSVSGSDMAAESPPEEFAADSQLTMRGRSASPGQYGAHGYRYVVRPASSGYPRAESHGITTPRTPRTPASKAVGAEVRDMPGEISRCPTIVWNAMRFSVRFQIG